MRRTSGRVSSQRTSRVATRLREAPEAVSAKEVAASASQKPSAASVYFFILFSPYSSFGCLRDFVCSGATFRQRAAKRRVVLLVSAISLSCANNAEPARRLSARSLATALERSYSTTAKTRTLALPRKTPRRVRPPLSPDKTFASFSRPFRICPDSASPIPSVRPKTERGFRSAPFILTTNVVEQTFFKNRRFL